MQRQVLDYINEESVVELLTKLIEIHSPYFHEEKVMFFTYEWLKEKKLYPQFHEYEENKITNFKGTNVIGRLKGKEKGPCILLNGHLDTVNVCEGWEKDPLKATREGNKLYGLGALDMKSGCTALLLALEAFKKTVKDFKGEILYSFVSDEEGPYGLGTNATIEDGIVKDADVAIVTEPSSGFCGVDFPCLCLGARGGYNYRVEFKGTAAHAANPEKGNSAILDCAKVMMELKNSEMMKDPKLGKGSTCIIEAGGGGQACSVADTAFFTVFRHIVRGEDKAYLEKELYEAVKRADIKSEVKMIFREGPSHESQGFNPYIVEENQPYVNQIIESIENVCNEKPQIAYFSSIGDFNYLGSRLKVPTFVFGANGGNYHTANEYVEIDSVIKTAHVVYEFLINTLGLN
ncbi:M20 family metallopeptidase [Crassaminicella profunda]|uniref:M20 family metallopeptidase n=1 Tax=Crassaminicella profunda TaxID=1286698 RepID=UPI001CA7AB67|nr:M20/M25/M40 family metallo-hydrolase [Crassaminicella profunda]QZY53914.1 M20/M25/M40 family metallo-hydrolase [Crassaminicella profunda]